MFTIAGFIGAFFYGNKKDIAIGFFIIALQMLLPKGLSELVGYVLGLAYTIYMIVKIRNIRNMKNNNQEIVKNGSNDEEFHNDFSKVGSAQFDDNVI
jgi:hypothetical protein